MFEKHDQAALTAASITSAAPLFGEHAWIVLAALFGALVALSKEWQTTRISAALFIFRAVAISTALTAVATNFLAPHIGQPPNELLLPVAFCIALSGDAIFKLKDWLIAKAVK